MAVLVMTILLSSKVAVEISNTTGWYFQLREERIISARFDRKNNRRGKLNLFFRSDDQWREGVTTYYWGDKVFCVRPWANFVYTRCFGWRNVEHGHTGWSQALCSFQIFFLLTKRRHNEEHSWKNRPTTKDLTHVTGKSTFKIRDYLLDNWYR